MLIPFHSFSSLLLPLLRSRIQFFICSLQELAVYDLYGVSNHLGSLTGGHYTAIAKNRVDKNWYVPALHFASSTLTAASQFQ
jgi:ubiquitin C-terminal hydrolase